MTQHSITRTSAADLATGPVDIARPRAARAAEAVNDGLGIAVLVYLAMLAQFVQVGIIPLLPEIGINLKVAPGTTSWLIAASIISGAIFLAVFSRVADLVGKRRVMLICLALALVGSVLGWIASSFTELVVARVLMGASFPMFALPAALVGDTMPRPQARGAIGYIHLGIGGGVVAGVVIGSLTGAGEASWRLFFAICAVAAAVGLGGVALCVQDSPVRAPGRLDWRGAALLSVGLVGLLLAFTQGPKWGWGSAAVLILGIGAIAVLIVWWKMQQRVQQPLIDVRQLMRREVAGPYLILMVVAFCIYASYSAIARIAQTPTSTGFGYGYSALQVAWYGVPLGVGAVIAAFVVRRLVTRNNQMAVLMIGIVCILVTFLIFGFFIRQPGVVMVGVMIFSLGLTITVALCQVLIVDAIDRDASGMGQGLAMVLYAIGNTSGTAVLGVLLTSITLGATALPALGAYDWGFAASGTAAALALVLCLLMWRAGTSEEARGGQPA